jgi:predicted dehydrogenase
MKLGIIGCGYWGPNLIRNFGALDCITLVGVSDLNPDRLALVKRQFPAIPVLTRDHLELITDPVIDAVALATPVSTHFPLGKAVLEAGKHLFVEKPFTATSDEARRLIDLAARKKLHIMVDHTFVYTGAVRKIKELIVSGELGSLYYFDSVRVNLGLFQHDVNVIWDLAPHDVSIMDFLLEQSPRAISATGACHFDSGVENIAYLSSYYDNNLIGHIHVNWLAPVKVRKTLVSGSRKMIIYDDTEPSEKVKVYDRGVDFVEDKDEIYNLLIQYRTGDMLAPRLDPTEALHYVVREFYAAVTENRPALTDGLAGLRVVEILEAANQSIQNNGKVVTLR